MKGVNWLWLMLLGAGLLLLGGGWSLPVIVAPPKPSLIVMMHESSHGPLPPHAIGAANDLTAAGREVRMVDDDVTDGLGETPDWLKPALEPGRAVMGGTDGQDDALVLLAGDKLVKALKLPATKEAIVEACK